MYKLYLKLKPRWKNNTVENMTVYAAFPALGFIESGEVPSLRYPVSAFGGLCPFPEWTGFQLTDDNGEIPYTVSKTESPYAAADFQGFFFGRKPEGMVKWQMTLLPRILPEGYRSSPYYDFRAEPYGLNGSGMFTFILPGIGMDKKIDVNFEWDLSEMPENTRGIWSYGEGRVEMELTPWEIMFTLYDVGVMHSVENGEFGVYWFSEPDFNLKPVAEKLAQIFHYERSYFGDEDAKFRVFLRRDPFEHSGGGSACPYAFISGYSAYGGTDENTWFNVLVHEMTHTWPFMTDFNVGEGTWFSEGATEYYCTKLPYEGGFVDASYTVDRLNDKITARYLDNPYRETPNMEIPPIQWKDRRAQTVPYGRGFLYLANTEAKLRRRNLGSIDEIVRRHSILNPMTPDEWETFIKEKLGDEGVREYRAMCDGKLPELEKDLFGPEIRTVQHTVQLDGVPSVSYHWELV